MSIRDVFISLNEVIQATDVNTGSKGGFRTTPYVDNDDEDTVRCEDCSIEVLDRGGKVKCPLCGEVIKDE